MTDLKILIDACYEIFSYKIFLYGYSVSLLNVFAFFVLFAVCIIIVNFLTK